MQAMQKKSIALLYGGQSGEHEVSLISASSVISHLNRDLYEIIPIGISKKGEWFQNQLSEVDPLAGKTLQVAGPGYIPFSLDSFLHPHNNVEVIFPVLHGTYGEDGCLQGYLELTHLPYVGANVLSSAICMDKDVTKRLAHEAGMTIPPYCTVKKAEWLNERETVLSRLEKLGTPLFVKPANTGSSVGISKVTSLNELEPAIQDAFQYDTKLVIEKGFSVREVELAVLENPDYGQAPLVSVAGEITTTHSFYSYDAKYLDEKSLTLQIPAQITEAQYVELKRMAQQIFTLLECEGMARADFFIDKETNQVIFNELNTIPGFTHVSMYPLMWQKSGLGYSDLLTTLIDLAIARQKRKNALKRNFD
jgi:D-alanine-D-alanine ligase